jgi:hypothetical protein
MASAILLPLGTAPPQDDHHDHMIIKAGPGPLSQNTPAGVACASDSRDAIVAVEIYGGIPFLYTPKR